MNDKVERIRRTYEIGDKVIFLKSGQECTVIGYNQQYNKLLNHKNRLLVCPDSGLKRSKPPVVARPVAEQRQSIRTMELRPEERDKVEATVAELQQKDVQDAKPKRRRKKSVVPDVQAGNGAGTEAAKQ